MQARRLSGANRDLGSTGARGGIVSLAVKASLCCAWLFCCAAHASDRQVVVEGGQRMGGVVRTSGHDVPLLRALEEILPTSYSVNVPNAGAWADTPVSWHAGGAVTRVLGEILSVDPALQARIDTDLRLVTVTAHARPASADAAPAAAGAPSSAKPHAQDAPLATAVSIAPAATGLPAAPPLLVTAAPAASSPDVGPHAAAPSPTVAVAAVAPASASESAPAPAVPPERTEWDMRTSDGSVRNALARWASETGWQFVWDVPTDFEVDATATIHGTLEQALRQVTNALAGSQVPIQVVLYKGNRVMRVVPRGGN
ncbi:toxin co-regulated pilus biosynthesis Q family protein [Trinickia diaoshuihuensis]|jgi:hypothetical protein|uniref:toxin co-regulated pilus biosynthesis Q family protein n=1 Tax=Trinickia diaoshuihuensis TaxID=2292265 RepID=UPI000E2558AA|nr:toxin co-regulated pilus biosynthesis Q family protein [Trinickia diaoshuihuensis]